MGFDSGFIRLKNVPLEDIEKHNRIKDSFNEYFYEGFDLEFGIDWVCLNFWDVHRDKIDHVGSIDSWEIHKLFIQKLGVDLKQTNALIIKMDETRINMLVNIVTNLYIDHKEYAKHIIEELEKQKRDTTDLYYEADW